MQTVLKRTGRLPARCARYGLKRTGRLAARCARCGLIAGLRAYKFLVSPLLPSACRYRPTCSEYMVEAIAKFGAVKGVWMGLKRLGRCHPFHEGGYDPVN